MPSSESVHVLNAYKRVLAEDIVSKFGVLDIIVLTWTGFAVRYNDIKNTSKTNPATLRIYNIQVPLEDIIDFVLPRNDATGFNSTSLPKGSDTVIPIENIKIVKAGNYEMIEIRSSIQKGSVCLPRFHGYKERRTSIIKGNSFEGTGHWALNFYAIYQVRDLRNQL